jgi:hypothetical protein
VAGAHLGAVVAAVPRVADGALQRFRSRGVIQPKPKLASLRPGLGQAIQVGFRAEYGGGCRGCSSTCSTAPAW